MDYVPAAAMFSDWVGKKYGRDGLDMAVQNPTNETGSPPVCPPVSSVLQKIV